MPDHQYRNADLSFLPSFSTLVGPKPPDDFVSNGATDAPDIVWGHDLRPAAHFHDFWYSAGCFELHLPRDEFTRYEADQLFRTNLKKCGLGRLRFAYYYRVRLWGHLCFSYSQGCDPKRTFWFWLNLLVGRYIRW